MFNSLLIVANLLSIGNHVAHAAPPTSKVALESYFKSVAEKTGKTENDVREDAVEALRRSESVSRDELERIGSADIDLSPARQREILNTLTHSEQFRASIGLDSLLRNGIAADASKRFAELRDKKIPYRIVKTPPVQSKYDSHQFFPEAGAFVYQASAYGSVWVLKPQGPSAGKAAKVSVRYYQLAQSSRGSLLAMPGLDRLGIFDLDSGKIVAQLKSPFDTDYEFPFPVFSPERVSSAFLVTARPAGQSTADWIPVVVDLKTGEGRELSGIFPGASQFQVSPDGKYLAIRDYNSRPTKRKSVVTGSIHMLNIKSGKEVASVSAAATNIEFSPDGSTLVAHLEDELLLLSPQNGKVIKRISVESANSEFGYSSDGQHLFVAQAYGIGRYSSSGKLESRLPDLIQAVDDELESYKFVGGREIAITKGRILVVRDLTTGEIRWFPGQPVPASKIEAVDSGSDDGSGELYLSGDRAYVLLGDGRLVVWDLGRSEPFQKK